MKFKLSQSMFLVLVVLATLTCSALFYACGNSGPGALATGTGVGSGRALTQIFGSAQ